MSKDPSAKATPLASVTAGVIAGAIEGFATYPAEFVKTEAQFASNVPGKSTSPLSIVKETFARRGIAGFYSGCGALVVGNATKAGVRFVSYDQFKTLLKDKEGKVTGVRSLVAGLCAGMMEAIFAVTPSETIKTKLIDDQRRETPMYRGLVHGTTEIVKAEGISGIYRGLFPVMMRQAANSGVRFSSYATIKSFAQGYLPPGQTLNSGMTFVVGGLAGVITVYATMPFDVLKTRMQTLAARTEYRNSFHCARRIYTEEGLRRFWRGATPRLVRLILSGGIVFTVYEKVIILLGGSAI